MNNPTLICLTCGKKRRNMATPITCQRCIAAVTKENERRGVCPRAHRESAGP